MTLFNSMASLFFHSNFSLLFTFCRTSFTQYYVELTESIAYYNFSVVRRIYCSIYRKLNFFFFQFHARATFIRYYFHREKKGRLHFFFVGCNFCIYLILLFYLDRRRHVLISSKIISRNYIDKVN